jgi:hypothetical protein
MLHEAVKIEGFAAGRALGCQSGANLIKLQKVKPLILLSGRVAEWFKAPVLKTGVPARAPWVRIPPLPPIYDFCPGERTAQSK